MHKVYITKFPNSGNEMRETTDGCLFPTVEAAKIWEKIMEIEGIVFAIAQGVAEKLESMTVQKEQEDEVVEILLQNELEKIVPEHLGVLCGMIAAKIEGEANNGCK